MPKIILILPDRKNRLPSGKALEKAGFRVSAAMMQGPEPNAGQERKPPHSKGPDGTGEAGGDMEEPRKAPAQKIERPWPA